MKKIVSMLAIVVMTLAMTSCVSSNAANGEAEKRAAENGTAVNSDNQDTSKESAEREKKMKIRFTDGTNEVLVTLNDSKLSESLVAQLPFTFDFEDYAHNEKNGRVPKKLLTDKSYEAECPRGSLGYFAPWGNLCLFFEVAPPYPGQYVLGTVEGNPDDIKKLGSKVTVEIVK